MKRQPSPVARLWQWWRVNYPDVARLVGVAIVLYGAFVDQGRNPALLPVAGGLVLLKNVVNGKGSGE